jgi:hypothetical protein
MEVGGSRSEANLGKSLRPIRKTMKKGLRGVAQVVEYT